MDVIVTPTSLLSTHGELGQARLFSAGQSPPVPGSMLQQVAPSETEKGCVGGHVSSRDGCDDTATEAALISIEVGKVQLNCTEYKVVGMFLKMGRTFPSEPIIRVACTGSSTKALTFLRKTMNSSLLASVSRVTVLPHEPRGC